MGSFYVENFGCRATQADGAAIERQFRERGLERAGTASQAEIVVLNTCTVTAAADQDARAAIRRIRRQNPSCQIVVTGCYAQRAPEEVAALPGVSQVIGNSHKHVLGKIVTSGTFHAADDQIVAPDGSRLGSFPEQNLKPQSTGRTAAEYAENFVSISQLTNGQRLTANDEFLRTDDGRLTAIHVSDIFAHTELLAAPVFDAANERTRPNLKVQDGCDNRCSFCVIPSVRGLSRSLPLDQVIAEVDVLVAQGYREVVISGINLGRWGRDSVLRRQSSVVSKSRSHPTRQWPTTNDQRLTTLIRAILGRTALEKLRISSVEPMDWSDELIALMANSTRIARHAHVPLQSGSDRVLRAMHRKYRPWHYREKIEKIHAAMPTAAIGADVMVGFPGETDSDFEATRRLIDELPCTYLHVFTYSARPGTPAAALPQQVPVQVARERNRVLREIATQKKLAFMLGFVGKTMDAITLKTCGADTPVRNADGSYTEALTDNYLKLRLCGQHEGNRWLQARVERVEGGSMIGIAS